jgi:hypothetical protein
VTWSTQSGWFDVAAACALYAAGAILFGRFEDHKPRGRYLELIRSRKRWG